MIFPRVFPAIFLLRMSLSVNLEIISDFSVLTRRLHVLMNSRKDVDDNESIVLNLAEKHPIRSSEEFVKVNFGTHSLTKLDGLRRVRLHGGLCFELGTALFCNFSRWSSPVGCCIEAEGGNWAVENSAFLIPNDPAAKISKPQSLICIFGNAVFDMTQCTLEGVFLDAGFTGFDEPCAAQVHGVTVGGQAAVRLCDVRLCRLRVGVHSFGAARLSLARSAIAGACVSLVLDDNAAVTLHDVSLSTDATPQNVPTGDPSLLLEPSSPAATASDQPPDGPSEPGCIACLSPTASLDAVDVAHSGPLWAPGGALPTHAVIVRARPVRASPTAEAVGGTARTGPGGPRQVRCSFRHPE